jgi:hypothetical protein
MDSTVGILDVPGDVLWLVLRQVIVDHLLDRAKTPSTKLLCWFEVGYSAVNNWDFNSECLARFVATLACICKTFKDVIKRKCVKADRGWFFHKGALTLENVK